MGKLAEDSNGSSLLWYEMEYSGSDIQQSTLEIVLQKGKVTEKRESTERSVTQLTESGSLLWIRFPAIAHHFPEDIGGKGWFVHPMSVKNFLYENVTDVQP